MNKLPEACPVQCMQEQILCDARVVLVWQSRVQRLKEGMITGEFFSSWRMEDRSAVIVRPCRKTCVLSTDKRNRTCLHPLFSSGQEHETFGPIVIVCSFPADPRMLT